MVLEVTASSYGKSMCILNKYAEHMQNHNTSPILVYSFYIKKLNAENNCTSVTNPTPL